jgi:CBS domain containing-hemolysin-like protein
VVGDDLDDLLGVVHVKYAMSVPRDRRADVPVSAIMTEPLRVPETMTLDNLLSELRGKGYQLAVVIDEYGGTAGLTTLEDVVEELIGEVADEHDRSSAGVVRTEGGITFPASLRPDELLERSGVVVPENPDYETVAGFVMSQLPALPRVGDEVVSPGGTLRVVRMDGRRIDRLRFMPIETPDGPRNSSSTSASHGRSNLMSRGGDDA